MRALLLFNPAKKRTRPQECSYWKVSTPIIDLRLLPTGPHRLTPPQSTCALFPQSRVRHRQGKSVEDRKEESRINASPLPAMTVLESSRDSC